MEIIFNGLENDCDPGSYEIRLGHDGEIYASSLGLWLQHRDQPKTFKADEDHTVYIVEHFHDDDDLCYYFNWYKNSPKFQTCKKCGLLLPEEVKKVFMTYWSLTHGG